MNDFEFPLDLNNSFVNDTFEQRFIIFCKDILSLVPLVLMIGGHFCG